MIMENELNKKIEKLTKTIDELAKTVDEETRKSTAFVIIMSIVGILTGLIIGFVLNFIGSEIKNYIIQISIICLGGIIIVYYHIIFRKKEAKFVRSIYLIFILLFIGTSYSIYVSANFSKNLKELGEKKESLIIARDSVIMLEDSLKVEEGKLKGLEKAMKDSSKMIKSLQGDTLKLKADTTKMGIELRALRANFNIKKNEINRLYIKIKNKEKEIETLQIKITNQNKAIGKLTKENDDLKIKIKGNKEGMMYYEKAIRKEHEGDMLKGEKRKRDERIDCYLSAKENYRLAKNLGVDEAKEKLNHILNLLDKLDKDKVHHETIKE